MSTSVTTIPASDTGYAARHACSAFENARAITTSSMNGERHAPETSGLRSLGVFPVPLDRQASSTKRH